MAFESRYIKGTLYLHCVESKGYKHKTSKWQAFEQGRSGHIGWQRVTLSNHIQRGSWLRLDVRRSQLQEQHWLGSGVFSNTIY